jgi:hypothetical protein
MDVVPRHRPREAPASWRTAVLILAGVLGLAVVLRASGATQTAWLQNFLIIFESLLIEAVPFILLGAAVSAAIEVFVPPSAFERLGRLPRAIQLPAAGVAGMAFPVCECGSVPVARRLASKGLSTSAAVTFMLAAPVVNPVVIVSTYVAYKGRAILWPMVLGRLALGLLVAICAGWVVGAIGKGALLKPRPGDEVSQPAHEEHHHHDPGPVTEPRRHRYAGHLAGDFLFMGRFLILGAFVAAALQTFVPQTWLNSLAGLPVLSLVAMMALAFLLSLCSESDAFVAASFVQFGVGAQLAFLVFGPMMDLKLGALYAGTFTRGFVRTVGIAVGAVTLVGALWIEVAFG